MLRRVLLVDPSGRQLASLRRCLFDAGDVVTCSDFRLAREHLLEENPQLLISNIRLGAFNGLHLAYLAAAVHPATRCILHDDPSDLALVAEAKSIGAFYETTSRLPFALPSYIAASLPRGDRRGAPAPERRTLFRGGRRSSDVAPEILGRGQHAFLH